MKSTGMGSITFWGVLGILTGCTTSGLAPSPAPYTAPVVKQLTSQIRSSDRMLYWQEEARELHAMGTHREREAELVLKKKPGPTTNEFATQMRFFAQQLHEAAGYADAQAKETERELPRDMIQQLNSAALRHSARTGISEIDAVP